MKEHIVLRVVAAFIIPFIMIAAFYVQLHGEMTPGGGFQAGVVMAASFILYALVFGLDRLTKVVSATALRKLAAAGVLIYGITGTFSFAADAYYLDYSFLLPTATQGQVLGIILIEAGVGLTVFSVMLLLFHSFADYADQMKGK
ncbi:MAG: Na(+)/H(+) antiporter subunit B [Proteobacteria bacterium]|nr:Na(+)/H(+) antiporter subunit B [Pseudomonadota bacterium]